MVATRQLNKDFASWLAHLDVAEPVRQRLHTWSQIHSQLDAGREMVVLVQGLNMDEQTLESAFLLPFLLEHDQLATELDYPDYVLKLLTGVQDMSALTTIKTDTSSHEQIDKLRKMLISMVADVRVVVLKLAQKVIQLQAAKCLDEEARVLLANEVSTFYAPLANRLGIGQLKWELEDLAFRYLNPQHYQAIAQLLDGRRVEREAYITDLVLRIQQQINDEGISAKVFGRPKHIFSIYKKMQKKGLGFDELYDLRALRIIAERIQDCYAALGVVHAHWRHLPNEFDDYVATPKANGYQSIHTVVIGPEGKAVEVQIRTQQMDNDAELGVAAHWQYKEGAKNQGSAYEERINWLRKILQWQDELSEEQDFVNELRSQVLDDRVYVFTPNGDVKDVPKGATPLDFAYYIHSNIGHRCIGTKVNGRIVPFTYVLQSGDQVEVITGKEDNPSRDWLHASLGYIKTSRARAKIHSYFRRQDRSVHISAGRELLERELAKTDHKLKELESILSQFNLVRLDDLFAAVGAGDQSLTAVINALQPEPEPAITIKTQTPKSGKANEVLIEGVGHLLSQLAQCCHPVEGDEISGFITQGRGVSVHKRTCAQFLNLLKQQPEREINVTWARHSHSRFVSKIRCLAHDRAGLLRDITTFLANEHISVTAVQTQSNLKEQTATLDMQVQVRDVQELQTIMQRMQQITGMIQVFRPQG